MLACFSQNTSSQSPVKITREKDSVGVYQLNMSIINKDVSGLLVFKQLSDSSFRVVLTSEMGPKILDMNISPKLYKTNFVISQLNKKRVLNSFYNDFAAITGINVFGKKYEFFENDSMLNIEFIYGKKELLRINQYKKRNYSHAGFFKKNKKQWEINYFYKNDLQLDSVFLKHNNFDLQMELRKIKM